MIGFKRYIDAACYLSGVSTSQFLGHEPGSGCDIVVMYRHAAMRMLRAHGASYNQIGIWLGRHHATVIHATRLSGRRLQRVQHAERRIAEVLGKVRAPAQPAKFIKMHYTNQWLIERAAKDQPDWRGV